MGDAIVHMLVKQRHFLPSRVCALRGTVICTPKVTDKMVKCWERVSGAPISELINSVWGSWKAREKGYLSWTWRNIRRAVGNRAQIQEDQFGKLLG